MNSKSKLFASIALSTLVFLLLGLLHTHQVIVSGGWLFSGYAYYGLGFPFPSLYWDVQSYLSLLSANDFITDASGNIISGKIGLTSVITDTNNVATFNLWKSLTGLLINAIFWTVICALLLVIWKNAVKTYKKKIALMVTFFVVLLTALSVFITSVDSTYNRVIARGAPFEFLKRYHLTSGDYSEVYYFEPFMFLVNLIIVWSIFMISWVAMGKIIKKNSKPTSK